MDGQNHKITATSATAGQEGHGVHLCHRCGWPFPNPHPSAKHRRAHKRVCGTVEGYKIIHSDDHLAVSDDDNASDDDGLHTPSPNILKKNAGSSGREGEKSAKSEDDVFSDAVTDFSDSGISPRLDERFESVEELGKSLVPKSVEGDLHGSGAVEAEESADRTEKSNDARSEEISNHGPLANGNNQPENVVLITDTAAKLVSAELTDDSQPEHGVGGSVHSEHGTASASVLLDPEEGKVLGRTIAAGESHGTVHDSPPPSEFLQTVDASEGIDTVVHSSERNTSTETVEVSLADETDESIDASVEVKEISHFTENIGSTDSVGEGTSPEESLLSTSSAKPNNEHSDAACTVFSIDKEEIPKASLDGGQTAGSFDESEGEKSDITGNTSLESTNLNSVDVNSALDSTTDACEVDTTTTENTTNTVLVIGNEKGEGASVEVEVIPVSTTPSEKLTEFSSSSAADNDAKSLQDHGVDKVTEVLQSVGCAGAGSKAKHDTGDALDKNSLPTFSVEHTVSPVTSELLNNIHAAKDVVEVEFLDVSETPELPISKESTSPLTDSVLPSRDTAKDDSCIAEDANASKSIVTTEVTAKDHESNVLTREISDIPTTPNVQESSPEVEPTHSRDDLSTSKSVDIIPSAELTFDARGLTSDECFKSSDAPSVKQTAPSPSNVQDFHGTSDTVDDKTLVNIDDKSAPPEVDDKSTKQTDDASAIDVSGSLTSRCDSLEANCGSVVSDTLETNSQKHKTTAEDAHTDKSDTFEPPSFMTLVQCGTEGDQVTAATEIETVQNNQQPKSDALQAGWFPSLTNVVNESEGRKKNEEMIAKVTNWSPVKQQHGPLKSLLSEVKSPNTKQVPEKVEATIIDVTTVSSVMAPETHTAKDQDTNKHVEEWNSPARYPIEIKKEKKKGRSFWVPFVCCSSAQRAL